MDFGHLFSWRRWGLGLDFCFERYIKAINVQVGPLIVWVEF